MTPDPCEAVRVSAMAVADGEAAPLSEARVQAHLQDCAACRLELARQAEAVGLLKSQKRHLPAEDLWPEIERGLVRSAAGPRQGAGRGLLLLLGLALVACKIAALCAGIGFNWAAAMFPLVLSAAVFRWLRENPFQISSAPRLEGESR